MTLVERYTLRGASAAWRVHRWWLAYFSLVLGATEDRNNVCGQLNDKWPLDTCIDSLRFRWLREAFLPNLVKESVDCPEPDQDNESSEALLPNQDRYGKQLPSAPPPHLAMPFCALPGNVHHLKWWVTKLFADNVDIFHMYAEMVNNECTEMQHNFLVSQNTSVLIITSGLGRTGLNLAAANYAVITPKL
jgi:hypothetical protein